MSDRLKISRGGTKDQILFMSFGLLNELCGIVQSPEAVAFITLDPYIRASILKSVLSERDEQGMISNEINLNTLDVSVEDVSEILGWVENHVMAFFMNALQRLKSVQEKYQGMVPANSTSTSTGTDD